MILSQLYVNKIQKLQEQKHLSDQMNNILTKSGGLNENNKKALRNLNAAIAVAKKPGYFTYHTAAIEIKEIEDNKVLNTLVRGIAKAGAELDQINSEIASASSRPQEKPMEMSLMSIGQWHDTYGKVTKVHEGMITQFEKNPKIYGGTSHHRSFKTVSSVMVKGLVTR